MTEKIEQLAAGLASDLNRELEAWWVLRFFDVR